MKKSEFKKLIKPIVQECIKESLLEDGLISGIIAEVVKGMSSQTIVEAKTPQPKTDPVMERMKANAFSKEQSGKLKEHKKKLMAAIGGGAYNGVDLFEGTTPIRDSGDPSATSQADPLSGQDPDDAGVDISGIVALGGKNWKALANS